MKSYRRFLEESDTKDLVGYDSKVMKIKTKQFDGTAHIKHTGNAGKSLTYSVSYKGKFNNGKNASDASTHRLVVSHNNGNPYGHKINGKSGKDLSNVLHKAAPSWVSLDDLEPKE